MAWKLQSLCLGGYERRENGFKVNKLMVRGYMSLCPLGQLGG